MISILRLLAVAILALVAMAAAAAAADNPAENPADIPADSATPNAAELLERKAAMEARIEQLQQQGGVYAAELQETWFELGNTLQALEAWEDATQAYDSAWQAARIGGGLEDPGQLPVLRRLLASHRAAGQWEKADATAHLIQHISSRAHAPGSPERLDALLQLGRWKLLAARDALLPDTLGTALSASELYGLEITKLEGTADYPGRRIHLATLHLEQASAEFLLANQIREQPLQEYFVSGNRSTTMLQCSMARLPDGRVTQVCVPVEVPNLDFYVDPANRKNQDIMRHLGEMRRGVEAAYGYLKEETEQITERDALLSDMEGLTASYNSFVTGNGL